jgi:predicted aminopeptidase
MRVFFSIALRIERAYTRRTKANAVSRKGAAPTTSLTLLTLCFVLPGFAKTYFDHQFMAASIFCLSVAQRWSVDSTIGHDGK